MATDPDAMWKPGYEPSGSPEPADVPAAPFEPRADAPRDVPQPNLADVPTIDDGGIVLSVTAPPPPAERRARRPRSVGAVAAVAAVAVTAVAAVIVTRPDRTQRAAGVTGVSNDRSLPTSVEPRWTTLLPGTGSATSTELEIGADDLVVAVVDDGSRGRTSLVGLDAGTGSIRWRRGFAFDPSELRILDDTAERLVLEQVSASGRRLFGLASSDGTTVWELDTSDRKFGVVLGGSQIPSRVVHAPDAATIVATEFVDPSTGEVHALVDGRPLSSDLAGTWLIGDANGIVAVDLSAEWTDPVAVSAAGVAPDEQLAVVDGRYVVLNTLGALVELVDDPTERRRPLTTDGAVPRLESIFPAGGPMLVGVGRGIAVGLRLDDDVLRPMWQVRASVRSVGVTPQGVVLALSEAGPGFLDGVDFIVVDAVTGERLAASGPAPSYDQLPLIVGDGFIITQVLADGRERIGYDLEGTELWRLPVTGMLRVGDGVVVTLDNTPRGFEVSMFVGS